jgi:hypothetical protein
MSNSEKNENTIDFEGVHKIHYDHLKKTNPNENYCIVCFDTRDVNKEKMICKDCEYVQSLLQNISFSINRN